MPSEKSRATDFLQQSESWEQEARTTFLPNPRQTTSSDLHKASRDQGTPGTPGTSRTLDEGRYPPWATRASSIECFSSNTYTMPWQLENPPVASFPQQLAAQGAGPGTRAQVATRPFTCDRMVSAEGTEGMIFHTLSLPHDTETSKPRESIHAAPRAGQAYKVRRRRRRKLHRCLANRQ